MKNTVPAWITAISTFFMAAVLLVAVIMGFRALNAFSQSMDETFAQPEPTPTEEYHGTVTAEEIAAAIEDMGFKVSGLKRGEPGYVEEVGGETWDVNIEGGGGDGILIFPNHEALTVWVERSKSMGGIAVVSDASWAISLDSDDREKSLPLAERLAKALDCTVAA